MAKAASSTKKTVDSTKKAVTVKKPVVTKKVAASSVAKKTAVKKEVLQAEVALAPAAKKAAVHKTISTKMVDLTGKDAGSLELPGDIFAAKVNEMLIAQAVRVYLANQREGSASTKSRGEVAGSTRKIYRQKGTGRARHGGIRAPIFVGGGIVFGPKPQDHSLSLSKKMRKRALFSALSSKNEEKAVVIVAGADKLAPKTKEASVMFAKLSVSDKNPVLFVVSDEAENAKRAARNLAYVTVMPFASLNTYDVMRSKAVVFTKEAASKMADHFLKGDK